MNIRNVYKIKQFTSLLISLMKNEQNSLLDSITIMSHSQNANFRNSYMEKAGLWILNNLKKGNKFSGALKTCPSIDFDEVYINFISIAENTGDLSETLSFLEERYERQIENFERIIETSIYPLFVMLMAFGMCIFICLWGKELLFLEDFVGPDFYKKIVLNFVFVAFLCTSFLCVITKNICISRLYEIFSSISFLLKNGYSLNSAIFAGTLIAGVNSKLGKKLLFARQKIEFGLSISEAFEHLKLKAFRDFYFEQNSKLIDDIFGKVALKIKNHDERKRKLCMQLIEPAFIALTGIFILSLVINVFMPVLNEMNFGLI